MNILELLFTMQGDNPDFASRDSRIEAVVFENWEFTGPGDGTFHQREFPKRIEFRNCVFKGHFSLRGSKFQNSVLFTGCVFEDGLWWIDCDFGEFFLFDNCRFHNTVNITSFDCFRFHFDDCIFYDMLVLANGLIKESERRSYGKMGGNLNGVKARHIKLSNNDFGYLTVHYHHIGKLEIKSDFYENGFLLYPGQNEDKFPGELPGKYVRALQIAMQANDKVGRMSVVNSTVKRVLLEGELSHGSILLDDVVVDDLRLEKFTNSASLKFIRVRPCGANSTVSFIESYLGKLQLFEIPLDSFSTLYIDNSHVTDIQSTYVTWPSHIDTKDNNPEKLKENYRQLKVAMKKQEDLFQALVFEQEEMEAYRLVLAGRDADWSEKFIFWSSKESNLYGRSWVLPLVWMVVFNFMFFLLIGFAIHLPSIDGFNDYLLRMGRVVHLFNPAHQAQLLHDEINHYNFALFADFLSRVSTSYFIFQTIKAFRKYSK